MISRRDFLVGTGTAVLAARLGWAADEFPTQLDHVIVGCNELEGGIRFVQAHTGVQAMRGGTHPDRGTWNALLSLGDRHFLEIIAPDPEAKVAQAWAARQLEVLKGLANPRLIGWAVHTDALDSMAKRFRDSGLQVLGPWPGSRVRPDGRVLSWNSFSLADDRHGLLPFFIEWSKDSVHPSSDAPGGCHFELFTLAEQDTAGCLKALRRIEVDAPIERSPVAQLRMRIKGPTGTLEVTS